jgi:hypothetical protein
MSSRSPFRSAVLVVLMLFGLLAVSAGTGPGAGAVDEVPTLYESPTHTFSIDDVLTDFSSGATEGEVGTIVCDEGGCPGEGSIVDKAGVTLHPIDSSYGFDVTDFVGGETREADGVFEEGWAGNLTEGDSVIGVSLSDAETSSLKSGSPRGTWAAGIGGSSVKASTEDYVVAEHVLTCTQSVPYAYYESADDYADDPVGNALPDPSAPCQPLAPIDQAEIDALLPNESSVITDIAVGEDYSVTRKDDGKLLYRWGNLVKRPVDIRLGVSLPLPEEWSESGAFYEVTRAELIVEHNVTNNPNDQIRPEDWENEAAIGVLPGYTVDEAGRWLSDQDCYEGDGNFIPAGTVLRDPAFAGPLTGGGESNAWFTTTDRDPFEWAYRTPEGEIVGSNGPNPALGELVSGPRWRLQSNKFGQNIPSLEIPAEPCSEPPFQQDNVKYEVGERTTTTLNLLDWADGVDSPLRYSTGWTGDTAATNIDPFTGETRCANAVDGVLPEGAECVSINGMPLTEDFDVAFYTKGDVKSLSIYNTRLVLEYRVATPPPTPDFSDVPLDHPFYTEITWLVSEGITTGYPDGTFRPTAPVTREAAAMWLYRYAGEPVGPFPDPGFTDVATSPFYDAIAWAAEAGVTGGFSDGTFRPASVVSRQAAVTWLYRYAGEPVGPFPAPGFTDVAPTSPFYDEIAWAAEAGVVEGFSDGTFRPTSQVTRQAMASYLYRYDQLP